MLTWTPLPTSISFFLSLGARQEHLQPHGRERRRQPDGRGVPPGMPAGRRAVQDAGAQRRQLGGGDDGRPAGAGRGRGEGGGDDEDDHGEGRGHP